MTQSALALDSSNGSIVCTVFENTYHLGVGALVNSLHKCGYRGEVYAAYRGALPPWVTIESGSDGGTLVHRVTEDLSIRFVWQDTDEMLANIKPQIINQVWACYGEQIDNVFYFDCDIVVKCKWLHFETWAAFGIALCEDINSPFHRTHPLRMQWKAYYAGFDVNYEPKDDTYVNGGFVGINRKYKSFADLWGQLQEYMVEYTGKQHRIGIADRWNPFHLMDQDALNVAKDLSPQVSVMGKEAMDFGKIGYVMSHAAGSKKPWTKQYLKGVLTGGLRPGNADKAYWANVASPIKLYSSTTLWRKRTAINLATLIGRFYTRT
ncbi:hypothetical protein [Neolewinella antarctica]|uniref:Glycosyltransferase n=1 Tax=Neolewinella antarctica TaxID=442734 RepID=A0ABX0XCZ5_9BACT|nr:hypothetical protein [Neolewinella antarctica]NJC26657.1 hypothetical protein [Neolewinella antarctica]